MMYDLKKLIKRDKTNQNTKILWTSIRFAKLCVDVWRESCHIRSVSRSFRMSLNDIMLSKSLIFMTSVFINSLKGSICYTNAKHVNKSVLYFPNYDVHNRECIVMLISRQKYLFKGPLSPNKNLFRKKVYIL